MKKLSLDVETLRVQSFAVTPVVMPIVDATRPQVCDPFTLRC